MSCNSGYGCREADHIAKPYDVSINEIAWMGKPVARTLKTAVSSQNMNELGSPTNIRCSMIERQGRNDMDMLVRHGLAVLLTVVTTNLYADNLTIPHTFTSGTPAVAAEVNANFNAVKFSVDDNNKRIATLETTVANLQSTLTSQTKTIDTLQTTVNSQANTIASLQSQLTAVKNSHVMALDPYLTIDDVSDTRGPLVTFSGVNVQIVNGLGSTATANGLGNLIVGYDEVDSSGVSRCTFGTNPITHEIISDSTSCSAAGGIWTYFGFKTGSHYVIVGSQNNYSRWGAVVIGYRNTSNFDFASVSGGYYNSAGGAYGSVSGGYNNAASGAYSSVSGGRQNTASGSGSSVSGGYHNTASSEQSSVSGGYHSIASGAGSSVSGGIYNIASGIATSVSGGGNGTAAGGNVADTGYSSILGGVSQNTSSNYQTIPALP